MTTPEAAGCPLRRATDHQLVMAARTLLNALEALEVALQGRDEAVAASARRANRTVRNVGAHLRATLTDAGFTEKDVNRLGVSDGNIRLICARVPHVSI